MNRNPVVLLLVGSILASWAGFGLAAETLFSNTKVFDQKEQASRHYMLPLGRVKLDRSLGRNVPTKYKRLDGEFSSTVWEITGGLPLEDAAEQVRVFLDSPSYEVLFQCRSRDCGDSFSWANSVFEQPVLYGNDRSQLLWTVKDRGARRYHVYYLVERPNRRLYFYEETLFVPELTLDATVIRDHLQREGHINLGEFLMDGGKVDVDPIIERIKPHLNQVKPELLVIHRHGSFLDVDIKPALETALTKAGINGVVVKDVANFAPHRDAPGEAWLEWVNPEWAP